MSREKLERFALQNKLLLEYVETYDATQVQEVRRMRDNAIVRVIAPVGNMFEVILQGKKIYIHTYGLSIDGAVNQVVAELEASGWLKEKSKDEHAQHSDR